MRLLYLSICLLLSSGIWSQSDSITTIYLIRHCEKETSSQDPELSEKGLARTQKWADFFEDLPIDLFYSTNTKRTATTCSMIADSQKKGIHYYNHNDFALNELVALNKGKTILIVGHSNTIPALINSYLGKEMYQMIPENEFGSLYTLTVADDVITLDLKFIND